MAITMHTTTDYFGRQILYSDVNMRAEVRSYEGCPFITLEKEDALAIYQYIKEIVEASGGNISFTLGDTVGLAYNRLLDGLNGRVNYKASK